MTGILSTWRNKRAEILEACELLDLDSVAELAYIHFQGGEISNEQQALLFAKNNQILFVEHEGNRVYPEIQVDQASGRIYSEIPAVINQAVSQGYSHWNILQWLLSFQRILEVPVAVCAPDANSIEGLLVHLEAHPDDKPPISYRPIDLLKAGEIEIFQKLLSQWLR